jgi:hypothetical protein
MIEPGAVDTPLTRGAPKVRPLIESIDPLRAEDIARARLRPWAPKMLPPCVLRSSKTRASAGA